MRRIQTAAWLALVWAFGLSSAALATENPRVGEHGQNKTAAWLPSDVQGLVIVPTVAEGHLVYLHGIAGKGAYLSRNEDGELCIVAPLHIVAGNFEQGGIVVKETGPVTLRIYSSEVSQALKNGDQVTSEHLHVTQGLNHEPGDVAIESGIGSQVHFILNPRRKWTSWLNGEWSAARCQTATEAQLKQLYTRQY